MRADVLDRRFNTEADIRNGRPPAMGKRVPRTNRQGRQFAENGITALALNLASVGEVLYLLRQLQRILPTGVSLLGSPKAQPAKS